MRTLTRKLLSLLLVFTMVCAMVPAAMAADGEPETTPPTEEPGTPPVEQKHEHVSDGKGWYSDKTNHWHVCSADDCDAPKNKYDVGSHDWDEWEVTKPATCKDTGEETRTCKICGYDEKREIATTDNHSPLDTTIQSTSDTEHQYTCSVCGQTITENHKWGNKPQYKDKDYHTKTCTVCGKSVDEEHTTTGTCACGYSSSTTLTASAKNNYTKYEYDEDIELSVSTTLKNGDVPYTGEYYLEYSWKGNFLGDEENASVWMDTTRSSCDVTCTVSAYDRTTHAFLDSDTVSWYAELDDSITVEVSVYNTGSYALGDEDIDGHDSVVDQIDEAIQDITDDDEELYYVIFEKDQISKKGSLSADAGDRYYVGDGLEDVTFTAYEGYKDEVSFGFTAYDEHKHAYSGTIVFNVEEGTASAGDIIYPAKSGDDVEFDVNDFEDFWEDKYSKGSLDYVTFGSVSSSRGDLVDADGDKVSSRTKYYADPTSKQADLDGVTFEPGRNTKTTVTIDFTAHGTNNSKRDAELSGTVVILYTEKDPEAIVYSSTGKNITLDADDFLDNYKDTMGSSASNIQIQFLEVPSNGTLYYNYNERTEKGTELTSKNVANYTFSTSSRASRSIEDVTYVPDSRGRSDTVRFACYTSGGDLRYYGEVTFGQTVQNVTVNMTSTSSGVTFQASTFFNADDALLSANTISFGTPSSGTLYKNWNGTSGTRVTASDMFSYVASVTGNASISTVTYVPVAGYSGTVTIPFSAYGAAGGIVSGTVSIRVTATTPTTIFTDVPTTGSQAWAYPFINRLAAAGVVSGVTPTTYGPKQTVKWGEALKMVLLGAGHPAQVEGTGSNWASGYLTYAVNNGIVSNTNINLSSNITRLEMAELAAKALGMSPASRINTGIVGPTDTTNGYVYALYNAGIVGGDSSSGQNRYNGGSTLLRDEMAKIVCGVMDNA